MGGHTSQPLYITGRFSVPCLFCLWPVGEEERGAHPCRSPSALRRPWSRCCPSVSSRCPVFPAASSGVAVLAEAGLFGEWLFCHNLQVSASQRGSCWSSQADFKIGSDLTSSSLAVKCASFLQKPFGVSLV